MNDSDSLTMSYNSGQSKPRRGPAHTVVVRDDTSPTLYPTGNIWQKRAAAVA